MKRIISLMGTLALTAGFLHAEEELADSPRWYVSPGVGMLFFEGNQAVDSPLNLSLRLGYDINEHWSVELEASDALNATANGGTRLGRKNGHKSDAHNIWGVGLDALYHFDRYERFDPYVSLGWVYYHGDDRIFSEGSYYNHTGPRLGIGAFYHLNDNWSLRADGRFSVACDSTFETLYTADLGIAYHFGGKGSDVAAEKAGDAGVIAPAAPKDTDGDGLTDEEEEKLGTDKFKADTDGDGLTDGEEVKTYKTDPLNPDTDFDGLTDGEEVKKYKTNPLERDTDKGGVSDGHEVLIDNTNPLDPKDDLMLFELEDVLFDYDTTVIKAKYYAELDQIVRVLTRNPNATAVVEGHADQRKRSNKNYNQKLSERRAKAVSDYLTSHGVKADKVTAKGFGYTRPKVQPDLVNGNPENRRVEIYIRGAGTNADKAKYAK